VENRHIFAQNIWKFPEENCWKSLKNVITTLNPGLVFAWQRLP
jgi:hypothetical protein